MGKRELLIALGFALVGLVAYIATARPSVAPQRESGLGAVVDRLRDRAGGAAAHHSATTSGTIPISRETVELALATFSEITVRGEDRPDLSWSLVVDAAGADDASAQAHASAVTLSTDDRGAVVALFVRSPAADRRTTTTLTLVVPSRLRIRLADARRAEVNMVAAIALDNVSGQFALRHVAGAVTGSHRNGAIDIDGATEVRLSVVGSQATLRRTSAAVALTCRNGVCTLEETTGPVTVESTNGALTISKPVGEVRVSGSNGTWTVTAPKGPVNLDARRAKVSMTLADAIPATMVATDGALRLELLRHLDISIDAVASQGSIDASSLGLETTRDGATASVRHTFGTAARVSLRTDRGAIEIVKRY